ncbi:MAG: DUF1634 domain-containing protein [Candidatus Binatus sp.]|uniref:DUF1634 domain-containing protein n=1 Tax=Candidatus Binatus sp. TaxID=2811406 RepID=UPI00271EA7D6|nr:DUF1634 domain-containing protein [Candidatus Binatus sp.]MDO8430981.1 DUF1634 domain-containing protein [Candidatus Binatus sp.]
MPKQEEDRILRVWTPILLRTILIVAMIVLIAGLVLTYTYAPDYYVQRYNAVQQGHLIGKEKFSLLVDRMKQGNPHAVLTIGLFVLTLVPLARVAFCFLLFIKERDYTFVAFTGYVLAGLIVGVLVGSVG